MCGALMRYITTENKDFQPMGANMGILPPLCEAERPRWRRLRYQAVAERAPASDAYCRRRTGIRKAIFREAEQCRYMR